MAKKDKFATPIYSSAKQSPKPKNQQTRQKKYCEETQEQCDNDVIESKFKEVQRQPSPWEQDVKSKYANVTLSISDFFTCFKLNNGGKSSM